MKPRLIALASLMFIASMFVTPQASASNHEKTFGVKTGYVSRNQSAIAGLFFQYQFTEKFRLAPEMSVAFRNDHRDAFLLDVNCHFPLAEAGLAEFYPYVGLDYSSWSFHSSIADDIKSKDVTNRTARFGLNVGGGMALKLSQTLTVKLEAGYTAVKSNSAFRATIGIGYNF